MSRGGIILLVRYTTKDPFLHSDSFENFTATNGIMGEDRFLLVHKNILNAKSGRPKLVRHTRNFGLYTLWGIHLYMHIFVLTYFSQY